MKTDLTGIVVGGMLKLDQPVAVPDHSRVRVTIELVGESNEGLRKALSELSRLRRERPIRAGALRYTRDELHERH